MDALGSASVLHKHFGTDSESLWSSQSAVSFCVSEMKENWNCKMTLEPQHRSVDRNDCNIILRRVCGPWAATKWRTAGHWDPNFLLQMYMTNICDRKVLFEDFVVGDDHLEICLGFYQIYNIRPRCWNVARTIVNGAREVFLRSLDRDVMVFRFPKKMRSAILSKLTSVMGGINSRLPCWKTDSSARFLHLIWTMNSRSAAREIMTDSEFLKELKRKDEESTKEPEL